MPLQSNRRKFIKHLGVGSIGATMMPGELLRNQTEATDSSPESNGYKLITANHAYNESYTGEFLNRIAFPIGGIGAGMFCLEGGGAISHMSIRHRPEMFNEPGLFGAIYIKGIKSGAKILEGPVPDWKKFGQAGAGNGLGGSITGLPHFHQAVFKARFPFATIDLTDADLPVKVQITGWSPFIPTDDDNSSLPVGALEYSFMNTGTTSIQAIFSYNAKNFVRAEGGKTSIRKFKNGFILSEAGY